MVGGGGGLTPEERSLIKGAQANLWTEFVPDEATAWYDSVCVCVCVCVYVFYECVCVCVWLNWVRPIACLLDLLCMSFLPPYTKQL